MPLLYVLMSAFEKCLFKSFAHLFNMVFLVVFLLDCKNTLYTVDASLLADMCHKYILPDCMACLFIFYLHFIPLSFHGDILFFSNSIIDCYCNNPCNSSLSFLLLCCLLISICYTVSACCPLMAFYHFFIEVISSCIIMGMPVF